jgi:putative addiction module component (TIGR02574 family)
MTDHTQALLHDALALPTDERAELVHDLLVSLDAAPADDPDQVAAAWNSELERRGRDVRNGDVSGADWPAVRARLRSELAGE